MQNEQERGGQAVVQFARSSGGNQMFQYAIKVFLQAADFDEVRAARPASGAGTCSIQQCLGGRESVAQYSQCLSSARQAHWASVSTLNASVQEARHYRDPVLRQVLPPLLHASENADGAARSRAGVPFPPFIVLERGIPLFEWAQQPRRQMESIVMVEALAELLATLHESGRVHRDLKPANVLLLNSSMLWRLLDMGIVAGAGASLGAVLWLGCSRIKCTHASTPGSAIMQRADIFFVLTVYPA